MKYFCMPSDFKYETIDKYQDLNRRTDAQIIETYGQLTADNKFGSCRSVKDLPPADMILLKKYVEYGNDRGIQFNYILNATCMGNEELTPDGYAKLKDFFKMLEDIGVSWVTISLPSLMEISEYVSPNLKIRASTVCQINSPSKAKFYEELGVKRIVLDEDIYRRFDILKNIRKAYTGDIEIIINSFCLNDCPYKMFHYNSLSHSSTDQEKYPYYPGRCGIMHLGAENYMKLNWIRPEDLHYYYDIGINYFKMQGRTNVYSGDPAKAVEYYMDGLYDGNLLNLLELFSVDKPMTIAATKIDNRKLDGFFDKFVREPDFCTKLCANCGYCKSFAEKSISQLDTSVMDIMAMMKDIRINEFPSKIDTSKNK